MWPHTSVSSSLKWKSKTQTLLRFQKEFQNNLCNISWSLAQEKHHSMTTASFLAASLPVSFWDMPGGRRPRHLPQQHSPRSTQGHWSTACSVLSHSLEPCGLRPTRFLWPWDFPGKNAGVGCHFLLLRIFPAQGSNPRSVHWQVDSITETLRKTTPPLEITATGLAVKKNENSEFNSIIQGTSLKRPDREFRTRDGRGTLCSAFCLFSESAYYQHWQINSNYQIKVVILTAW